MPTIHEFFFLKNKLKEIKENNAIKKMLYFFKKKKRTILFDINTKPTTCQGFSSRTLRERYISEGFTDYRSRCCVLPFSMSSHGYQLFESNWKAYLFLQMSTTYFLKSTLLLRAGAPVSMLIISFPLPFHHRAAANCNSLLLASLSHVNFSCFSQRFFLSDSSIDYRSNLHNSDSLSHDCSRVSFIFFFYA